MSTNIAKLFIDNVNGSTFISINTSTSPRMLGGKKHPFLNRVKKVTEGAVVMVFQNKTVNAYDNMVKRRLVKEGKSPDSFTLSPRTWGRRIPNTPFVEHKGQYYLEVIFLNNGKTHYELDGVTTPEQAEWKIQKNNEEGKQGGLEDKVIIRTFKVENLTSVTINKHTYTDLYFDPNVNIPVQMNQI